MVSFELGKEKEMFLSRHERGTEKIFLVLMRHPKV